MLTLAIFTFVESFLDKDVTGNYHRREYVRNGGFVLDVSSIQGLHEEYAKAIERGRSRHGLEYDEHKLVKYLPINNEPLPMEEDSNARD